MSLIHEEQDLCQTIKAAEVVNVTNSMQYILNLHFNRHQNYYSLLQEMQEMPLDQSEVFLQAKEKYYEEQQELTKRSAIHCPEPNLVSRCTSNTKHNRSCTYIKKYPARKLIEVTASRYLKLSTHAGEIKTKLNSTMHSTNPNQA